MSPCSPSKKANKIGSARPDLAQPRVAVEEPACAAVSRQSGSEERHGEVVNCATCSFRVSGLADLHCCNACAVTGGTYHSPLCLRLPSEPLAAAAPSVGQRAVPFASSASSKGSGDDYINRLQRILANGGVRLDCLPATWDAEYGSGNWAKVRPVKSALKAVGPYYTKGGIEVVDRIVYAVQSMDATVDATRAAEQGARRVAALPDGMEAVVNIEMEAATKGHNVAVIFARGGDACRCSVTVRKTEAADAENSGEDSQDDANQAVHSPQVFATGSIVIEVEGFGKNWDEARLIARIMALEKLGRWSDVSEERSDNLLKVRHRLQQIGDWVETSCFQGAGDVSAGPTVNTFFQQCHELAEDLILLVQAPPKCIAACWDTLRVAWPYIVNLQDKKVLWKVVQSLHDSQERLPMYLWAQMGEVACWALHINALEYLVDLPVAEAEASNAGTYVKENLYSLFLEQRAQLNQELERVANESRSPYKLEVSWQAHRGWWKCSFKSEAIAGLPGAGGRCALLLSWAGDIGRSVLCEVTDDGQAVLRGSAGVASFATMLSTRVTNVQFLSGYLVVHARQREAVLTLLDQCDEADAGAAFDPALRRLLLGSWGRDKSTELGAHALQLAATLAAGAPGPIPEYPDGDGRKEPENDAEKNPEQEPEQEPDRQNDSEPEDVPPTPQKKAVAPPGFCASQLIPSEFSAAQGVAVANALSRRLSMVRGPPGTGKTHVAAGIVSAFVRRLGSGAARRPRQRALITTQSNVAALNLHRRLELFGVSAARIGTTLKAAEVLEQKVIGKLKPADEESLEILRNAAAASYPPSGHDAHMLSLAQFAIMRRMAEEADAVVCTCASSGNRGLFRGMGKFPLLVMDEAAQFIEPSPWVPLGLGQSTLVAVGDERQLPATILDDEASRRNLGVSMFERCVRDEVVVYGVGFIQLDVQHRMHPSIAAFPAAHFYDTGEEAGGGIANAPEVHHREIVPGFPWPRPGCHVCFVDCGKGWSDGESPGTRSRQNRHEAELLMDVFERALNAGMDARDIAVITGYSAQQALLKRIVAERGLHVEGLKIDTIDGFQGAERDLVLASTVRANEAGKVGFMKDRRRVNVLLTRARRGLVVFGDSETLWCEAETWQPWLRWASDQDILLQARDLENAFANADASPPPPPPEQTEPLPPPPPPPPPLGPPPGRRKLQKGQDAKVIRPDPGGQGGYLSLELGQIVYIDYVGEKGEEEGWLFGTDVESNEQGWFEASCVEACRQ